MFFFVERCGDHRDLHSFPTRRSSDLDGQRQDDVEQDEVARDVAREPLVEVVAGLDRPGAAAGRERQRGAEDRKSTRLNSSHGYISYAVFCLKKKKSKLPAEDPEALQE